MGWFSKKESPPASTTPARQGRQQCWDSRDKYYSCLDACGVLVPGEEAGRCSKQLAAYEENCAKSWIEYFNQRRVLTERQKASLDMANTQAAESRRKT